MYVYIYLLISIKSYLNFGKSFRMDEFGVLVESIGFKAHGKSAPMAHLKSKPKSNYSFNSGFPENIGVSSANSSKSSLHNDFFVDDLDGIFKSKSNISSNGNNQSQKSQNFLDDGNDIFGASFSDLKPPAASSGTGNLDSAFDFNRSSSKHGSKSSDDLLTSTPRKNDAIDDLLGNFGSKSQSFKSDGELNGSQFDDLIPGFGGSSLSSKGSANNGMKKDVYHSQPSSGQSSKSSSAFVDDPFLVFESSSANASSWPFFDPLEEQVGKGSVQSPIDDLEKFAMGKVQDDANDKQGVSFSRNMKISVGNKDGHEAHSRKVKINDDTLHQKREGKVKETRERLIREKKGTSVNGNNLDDFFGLGSESRNLTSSTTEDLVFDTLYGKGTSEMKQTSRKNVYNTEKSSSGTIFSDNFSSLFGEAASSSEAFQEIEGETQERRRARLNHHMRTQARMAKALADKNQRDLQTQYEQEERRKLAASLDDNIKRWAAGKEGNLRALLSSLQDVLWPDCGWRAVSLTDLITSVSVKKVYQKATLCVHPDKVQQKGANLKQKYIAEKVFDILKEAWNKFNAEELR